MHGDILTERKHSSEGGWGRWGGGYVELGPSPLGGWRQIRTAVGIAGGLYVSLMRNLPWVIRSVFALRFPSRVPY